MERNQRQLGAIGHTFPTVGSPAECCKCPIKYQDVISGRVILVGEGTFSISEVEIRSRGGDSSIPEMQRGTGPGAVL